MNKNPVRDGETRRPLAAARIGPVITTRAVTNGAVATRLAHGGKRLVVGHIRFGSSLSPWQLSQALEARELEARVVQSENGRLVGHPYWFGGEHMDLAGVAPHEYMRCRLNGEAGVRPQCCVARPGAPHAHVPCADVYMDRSTAISKNNPCLQKKDCQRASNTAFPIQNGRIQRRK